MLITLLLLSSGCANMAMPDMHPQLPAISPKADNDENTGNYWNDQAQKTISAKIAQNINTNVAKNVILFLGDGMSVPTIAAARVYLKGEEAQLSFDKFPYTGLSKTYAVDRQVPDSANTATAYLCGIKGNYGTIGVSGEVLRDDCDAMLNTTNHALSIAYHSQVANKKTGLVTTARVTHASPAGVYAHTANRDWECDSDIGEDESACSDIAQQLVYGETGRNLDVILGGGRNKFYMNNETDDEGSRGQRGDGVNLITEWLNQNENAQYVWNRDQLLGLDENTEKVLGLFASDHMDYNMDRNAELDPSLAEMTEAAIKLLSKSQTGFFLFVEGAKIDMAHHENRAQKALNETTEFSEAIQKAVDLTDENDTLIVVTSDHAHTLSYSGYAQRGNNILEFGGEGEDGLVYTTLNYANGPGYRKSESDGTRHDFSKDDWADKNFRQPGLSPRSSETHGGEDVAIFSRGPWAHMFSGVLEENVIPHLMAYASCVGDGLKACP